MSASTTKTAPRVTMLRDFHDRQVLLVDMSVGYLHVTKSTGPKFQQTVLGGSAVTIYADFNLMRFRVGPSFLKEAWTLLGLQHVYDLPEIIGGQNENNIGDPEYEQEKLEQHEGMEIDSLSNSQASGAQGPQVEHNMGISPSSNKPATSRVTQVVKVHIKRPRNSWIIYRSEKSRQLHQSNRSLSAADISSEVSLLWQAEPDEVKAYYQSLADEEARQHMLKYPEYRYKPGRQ